jgi:hypothetical protein
MTLCFISADWFSAIVSGIALLATIYTIYDTRVNAVDLQKQVDSLADLAKTYQRSRRDDIMPNLVIDGFKKIGDDLIIDFRNDKKPAYNITLKKCTINNHHVIQRDDYFDIIDFNVSKKIVISNNELVAKMDAFAIKVALMFEFKNKDYDLFVQIIESHQDGSGVHSYPPTFIQSSASKKS